MPSPAKDASSPATDSAADRRARAAAAAEARLGGGQVDPPSVGGREPATAARGQRRAAEEETRDPPQSELLGAFDRAIAAAVARVKLCPEDRHHVPALRKARAAVLASLERGDNISLGVLHTLKGVGHWVVEQLREHLQPSSSAAAEGAARAAKRPREAPATPNSFSWWYIGKDGKRTEERNGAEVSGPLGQEQYRVCILHSSGRMEKAWLPDAKAPPRSPKA